jgi:Fe2+ or Zn2+ uptake regulation protein
VREGLVESVYVGDGRVRYGLISKHHDHLVCLSCGDWEPLAECLMPQPPRRLPSGFEVTGHQLELYGYCARCQAPVIRGALRRSDQGARLRAGRRPRP